MNVDLKQAYGRVIGLTGIMGSGKSTAAGMFARLSAVVIDADQLAREVVSHSYAGYAEIRAKIEAAFGAEARERFATSLYDDQGELKRKILGQVAFSNPQKVDKLNQILHASIQILFRDKVEGVEGEKVIIYDVPLLFETHMQKVMKKTIVVYVPEEVAVQRATARTGLPEQVIRERLANQISIEKKRLLADYVLENTGTPAQLEKQVNDLWKILQALP